MVEVHTSSITARRLQIAERLVVVADLHVVAVRDHPIQRRNASANVFSSVDFPEPFGPMMASAAAADLQGEVLHHGLGRISGPETVRRQRDGAGARAAVEVELGQRLVRLRPVQLVDLVEHLPSRLGLLGLLPGEVAADEVLRIGDVLLLPLVVLGHLLHPLAAELEKLLVVAVVLDELSVRELDDLRDGAIEKRRSCEIKR